MHGGINRPHTIVAQEPQHLFRGPARHRREFWFAKDNRRDCQR